MIELDGDEERISSQGRYAERDIVQFVPFRDYIDRRGNHILSMARLAKEVLAEIPDQFLSYMRTRGIKPGPLPPPYTPCPPSAVHPLLCRRKTGFSPIVDEGGGFAGSWGGSPLTFLHLEA
ncbi:Copine-8 [Dissostichus eleginoides]|nr:Copine-8 [Dissostichus eleginoides]